MVEQARQDFALGRVRLEKSARWTRRIDQRRIERRPAFDPSRFRDFARTRFAGPRDGDLVKYCVRDQNFAVNGAQLIEPAGTGKRNDR